MAADKSVLEKLGSRAIAALRAAFPDGDDAESVAFRQAVESMTVALVNGGVRTPVIDQAIAGAVNAFADMPMDSSPLSNQSLAELGRGLFDKGTEAAPAAGESHSLVEQIRAIKAQIATEPSLQIKVALLSELEDAAAELSDVKLTKAVAKEGVHAPSGIFLASLGNPVRDAQALIDALHTAMPGRGGEVQAMRGALEAVAKRLYSSGVGGAVIGGALGDALDVYASILPSDHVKAFGNAADPAGGALPGYVLAFPGQSEVEADELLASLKSAGNIVLRVEGDVAQAALSEAMNAAGIEPSDLEPN